MGAMNGSSRTNGREMAEGLKIFLTASFLRRLLTRYQSLSIHRRLAEGHRLLCGRGRCLLLVPFGPAMVRGWWHLPRLTCLHSDRRSGPDHHAPTTPRRCAGSSPVSHGRQLVRPQCTSAALPDLAQQPPGLEASCRGSGTHRTEPANIVCRRRTMPPQHQVLLSATASRSRRLRLHLSL